MVVAPRTFDLEPLGRRRSRPMLSFDGHRTFHVVGPTDMRKSLNGLAGLATGLLDATPASRNQLVFANRARNRIKVLLHHESSACHSSGYQSHPDGVWQLHPIPRR